MLTTTLHQSLELIFANKPLLYVCLFIIGICVGSFLNVVVYRLPIMLHNQWQNEAKNLLGLPLDEPHDKLNLATPGSHCPKCQYKLKLWQNIPLISYVILRGKCYNCQNKIPLAYPMMELFCGVFFIVCAISSPNIYFLLSQLVFSCFIISLIVIDYKHFILPDELTLSLMWLGIVKQLFTNYYELKYTIISVIIGYLTLWLTYWIFKLITKREGLGYGDFKMLAAILAWSGAISLPQILLIASGLGILYFVIISLYEGKHVVHRYLPFGTFMGVASLIFIAYPHLGGKIQMAIISIWMIVIYPMKLF